MLKDYNEKTTECPSNFPVSTKNFSDEQPSFHSALLANVLFQLNSVDISEEGQKKIQEIVGNYPKDDLGGVMCALYEKKIIPKKVLIDLFVHDHALSRHPQIRGWWEQEKNTLRLKYCSGDINHSNNNNNNNRRVKNSNQYLQFLLGNTIDEKILIENLAAKLTQYARENFYTYKSGNTYYYSIQPNDQSIGCRFDKYGQPLKDGYGNELTDEYGEFIYATIAIRENQDGSFTEIKKRVPRGTPDSTPLTDSNGTPLATTYRQIVQKDKPKDTKKIRADAINGLFQLIDTMSADDIYRYMTTPSFQVLIGSKELTFTPWKTHLADICSEYTEGYKKIIFEQDDEALLNMLMDEKCYKNIKRQELIFLFWRHNPLLIADVVVNLYGAEHFNGHRLDFVLMQKLIAGDEVAINTVNAKRCELKTKLILPKDSRVPGKNVLGEESLTKTQLFQYDDTTIAAVEQWIRVAFSDQIINCVDSQEFDMSRLNRSSPYYFYQIQANSYMLLEPSKNQDPNYYRYRQLKKDLPALLNDPNVQLFDKPIIFFGIFNIDGNHYLPFFIYTNRGGKIFVITVDPSPHVYPKEVQDNLHIDTKSDTHNKLMRIFEDILPGCNFMDPAVTQMLRERDCGPNAAQTLTDVFEASKKSLPLLIIDDQDCLRMDSSLLTLTGYPHGVNPYTETFVYSGVIETNSNLNRNKWEQHLSRLNFISHYIRPGYLDSMPLSILDPVEKFDESYNYLLQVDRQTLHDERNTNISAIQSLLLSDEVGRNLINSIIIQYKKNLQFSHFEQLEAFAKSKIELSQLEQFTSAHQKNLHSLMEDVQTVLLKDHIPEALEASLQMQILNQLPNRSDLNAQHIVSEFLERHQSIFKKLSPHDQIMINDKLLLKAGEAVRQKLTDLHRGVIIDVISNNCFKYLTTLISGNPVDINELASLLQQQLDYNIDFFQDYRNKCKPAQITQSIRYLKIHDLAKLKNIIFSHVSFVAETVLSVTLAYVKQAINFNESHLRDLLLYFDEASQHFIPPSPKIYLPLQAMPNIISRDEISSVLGSWLIPQIESSLYQALLALLPIKAKEQVKDFVAVTHFLKDVVDRPLVDIDQLLSADNELTICIDYTPYISEFGCVKSITVNDYKHALGRNYIFAELQHHTASIFVHTRDFHFDQIATMVIEENTDVLTYSHTVSLINMQSNIMEEIFNLARLNQNAVEQAFVPSLVFFDPISQLWGWSETGKRFCQHFNSKYLSKVYNHLSEVTQMLTMMDATVAVLKELEAKRCINVNNVIENKLNDLSFISSQFLAIPLFNEFETKFALLRDRFANELKMVCRAVYKKSGYDEGDVIPGTVAGLVRPTFCSIFGIHTEAILTSEVAMGVDKDIDKMISAIPDSLTKIDSQLIIMDVAKKLPDTYNQKLSFQLLSEIISYWYCHHTFLPFLTSPPRLIQALITVANNSYASDSVRQEDIDFLKKELPSTREEQLNMYLKTDLISQVAAALLRSVDLSNQIHTPSPYTFTQLTQLLHGQKIDSNKNSAKQNKPISSVESALPVLSKRDFDIKLFAELKIRNKKAHEESGPGKLTKPKVWNITEVKTELLKSYQIEVKEDELEQDEDNNNAVLPRVALQRPVLMTFGFFETDLDQHLVKLKRRHESGDYLDDWDMSYLRAFLDKRWRLMVRKGKHTAVTNPYLRENPGYADQECIAIAKILSQYYQKQGGKVYTHDLLMPNHFTALRTNAFPDSIAKKMQVFTSDITQNNNNVATLDIKMTVEDIPLSNLIVIRSGYALNIFWINYAYLQSRALVNPYTNNELTHNELNDILKHPGAHELVENVKSNCIARMSKRAIDLLEDYVIGTVHQRGFKDEYTDDENATSKIASEVFCEELAKLSRLEAAILMRERIPLNQDGLTVETVIKRSPILCIAGQGVFLARVVVAYKPVNKFPQFILQRVGVNIPRRHFSEIKKVRDMSLYSNGERHILSKTEDGPTLGLKH
ncbi:MAG: hypothetical protein H0U71_07845 [Gammaproteobacteria bacterium]|nr:hypothetical protein [Gammaproteobacteria bacterium]